MHFDTLFISLFKKGSTTVRQNKKKVQISYYSPPLNNLILNLDSNIIFRIIWIIKMLKTRSHRPGFSPV